MDGKTTLIKVLKRPQPSIIAASSKDLGILTVAVVTKPFFFEGPQRMKNAQAGIEESAESINIQRQKVEQVNASFTEVEAGMAELEAGVDSMSHEVEEVLEANKAIVDSISLLSAASQEVSAGTMTSKSTIDGTFANLHDFSQTVEGTFEQLQTLKEAAEI